MKRDVQTRTLRRVFQRTIESHFKRDALKHTRTERLMNETSDRGNASSRVEKLPLFLRRPNFAPPGTGFRRLSAVCLEQLTFYR